MFSLVAEFLAFIWLLVLAIHLGERERVNSYFAKKFWRCLLLAVLSVLLNALTVLTIAYARAVPLWLNMLVNSAYFLVSYAMTASFAQYLFEKLLSHVYDGTCIRRATRANRGLLAAAACVTVLNLSTGLVFYFDADMQYRRGPLNGVGYMQVAADAALLIYCYLRHRGSVDAAMKRVVRVGVPVTALLVVFQQMYPGVLLNGTMGAFMAMILFVNFQSQRVEMDAITQLGNRSSFLLELEMQLAARQPMQVILVSLCQFGAMNLAYGYEKGDEILYEIAHWLDGERGKGKVFRFSPVTFAMLQPAGDGELSPQWAERVLNRFKGEWSLGDSVCRVPARVLDMDVRGGQWTVAQIVECLEFGQMRLKQEGLGYLCFSDDTARALQRRKYLADCMRRCIAQRTVEVWYQPVYCPGTGAFSSAEALVRLRDGEGELLPLGECIPLAEESGLIGSINRQVLERVCAFLGTVGPGRLEMVTINLAVGQLAEPAFVRELQQLLKERGVAEKRLGLEITERMLISEEPTVRQTLERLADGAFPFLLDDFGVGYSNFSRVLHFPFAKIKLDCSLIQNIQTDHKSLLTVQAVIDLFHRSGMEVVAEGIETQSQAEQLQALGADYLQGFYFARPMPEEDLLRFLEGHGGGPGALAR